LGQVVSETKLISCRGEWKRDGRVVVCASGAFDLLHPGHIRLLERARELGHVLVAAVESDAAVRRRSTTVGSPWRGPLRPVTPASERGEVLAALAAVDFVVLFEESSPWEFLARLAPEIVVEGREAAREERHERPKAARWKFVHIPPEPGYSTSGLLARICPLQE
jgi:rfaE bifunctional protein nucleotidyltransferase chain/domain